LYQSLIDLKDNNFSFHFCHRAPALTKTAVFDNPHVMDDAGIDKNT